MTTHSSGICVEVEIEQLRKRDCVAWKRASEILNAISLHVCASRAPDLNYSEHEDVAQEAVAQIVDYVGKVESFEECKKLIVTITKHRLHDRFRQRASQKHGGGKVESLDQLDGFDAPDQQNRPDEDIVMVEQSSEIEAALEKIPEKYRKVIHDYYFLGLTHQQIAEKHGLKIGSVGVYLDRGLKALHKVLPKKDDLM